MNDMFPSIWVEITNKNEQNKLVCVFYREWSDEGTLTTASQLEAVQFEKADSENKQIIALGDANQCSSKWNEPDFKLKLVAEELKGTLAQCGIINLELGLI